MTPVKFGLNTNNKRFLLF